MKNRHTTRELDEAQWEEAMEPSKKVRKVLTRQEAEEARKEKAMLEADGDCLGVSPEDTELAAKAQERDDYNARLKKAKPNAALASILGMAALGGFSLGAPVTFWIIETPEGVTLNYKSGLQKDRPKRFTKEAKAKRTLHAIKATMPEFKDAGIKRIRL